MLNLFQSTFLISSLFFFIWIITNTYYSLFFKWKILYLYILNVKEYLQ